MTITLQAVNELIQSLESAGELSIKETKVLALAKAYQQLAAENVALKDINAWCKRMHSKTCTGSLKRQRRLDALMRIACMMQCLSQLCMRLQHPLPIAS
ncbi:Uncharacterised protein [Klebsiella michiganensis]|nr:Uncharacterised protein [Klebsiella michiganensis]